MTYLDFEKPIEDLQKELDKLKEMATKSKADLSKTIAELEVNLKNKIIEVYSDLTPWQRVQVSRHPERPYTLAYIDYCSNKTFMELHGDRTVGDDKAMVGGFGDVDGQTVMFIGQQKGINTKMRQIRRFGMANPEGYRKALRLMKMAEKFNKPIVTFIDTPGAYPGLEAEERGQGEAIARNIYEMIRLKVPVIVIIIGEGASGGAFGIGIGDKTLMMENTWYTVISPESCSSILWRTWDKKEIAAEQLRLTATDMKGFGLVDEIVSEPLGGAHWDYDDAAQRLKSSIKNSLAEIEKISITDRVNNRINKYCNMGFWDEIEEGQITNSQ